MSHIALFCEQHLPKVRRTLCPGRIWRLSRNSQFSSSGWVALLRSDSADVATILPDALDYTTTLFGKGQKDMEPAETAYTEGLLPALGIKGKIPYNYASDVLLKERHACDHRRNRLHNQQLCEGNLLKNGGGTR
jgi:hypothetical protein